MGQGAECRTCPGTERSQLCNRPEAGRRADTARPDGPLCSIPVDPPERSAIGQAIVPELSTSADPGFSGRSSISPLPLLNTGAIYDFPGTLRLGRSRIELVPVRNFVETRACLPKLSQPPIVDRTRASRSPARDDPRNLNCPERCETAGGSARSVRTSPPAPEPPPEGSALPPRCRIPKRWSRTPPGRRQNSQPPHWGSQTGTRRRGVCAHFARGRDCECDGGNQQCEVQAAFLPQIANPPHPSLSNSFHRSAC